MGIKTISDYEEAANKKKGNTTFAGGEQSGLAIDQPVTSSNERMELYADGFMMLGRFRPFSEPGNRELWEAIKAGEAPAELREVMRKHPEGLTVEIVDKTSRVYNQEPERRVEQASHLFQGPGYSLSPTAGPELTEPHQPSFKDKLKSKLCGVGSTAKPFSVDNSKPTITLNFRYLDGSRGSQTFNLHHNVDDVYQFVTAHTNPGRPFQIVHGFPPKALPIDINIVNLQNELLTQR
ncbi:UBX domain protein [Gregarina niphandrodes]|uniref:UBX domain protein n=1 Tax=Gregarina niphandrodes TaxID=110365 RepID=A0A023B211_GRENI|nr:UBX domain protein [Gregarina niphandrodes]EZG47489.1 UBX domain protein [Gregarina niphandrodes]|eukprot:XP_011132175.1 UBX domain protein [Gregarina niphandrodes]